MDNFEICEIKKIFYILDIWQIVRFGDFGDLKDFGGLEGYEGLVGILITWSISQIVLDCTLHQLKVKCRQSLDLKKGNAWSS